MFLIPIDTPYRLIGTLAALRHTPRGTVTEEDQAFYLELASRAATIIINAKVHREVELQALTDTLTGVYNRRGFEQFGRREMERFWRYHTHLSAIVLDIDLFKSTNDRYGHAFGDEVLKALTNSCTENIRKMDITCRFGGDEFVILLPETDLSTARGVANRIRACFSERTFLPQGEPVHLTASFGVARATQATGSLDALIEDADTALYRSKLLGRNRVEEA